MSRIVKRKAYLAMVVFLYSVAIITISIKYFLFSSKIIGSQTTIFVFIALALTAHAFFSPAEGRYEPHRSVFWIGFLCSVSFIPFAFIYDSFGAADVGSILITLRENTLDNTFDIAISSFRGKIVEYSLLLFFLTLGSGVIPGIGRAHAALILMISVMLAVFNPISNYAFRYFVPSAAQMEVAPEKEVGQLDIITRPVEKKNLVLIYLESLERTYGDIPEAAPYFKPLLQIESNSLTFHGLSQVEGLHYTAGGLVGSECGVPLIPKGIIDIHKKMGKNEGVDAGLRKFLPDITCLGDILGRDGYNTSYMNGSNLTVFGKGDFFRQHGFSRVFGRDVLPQPVTDARQNIWGMDDEYIFESAAKEIRFLAGQNRPFLFSMLTLSTHGPSAFLDSKCRTSEQGEDPMLTAIKCTGNRVKSLLDLLNDLGIEDNTMVVIMSDHLAMKNSVYPLLEAVQDRRSLLAMAVGKNLKGVQKREGTSMDMFPTILELLGYEISGHQANLGVSLISDRKTLVEEHGLKTVESAIFRNGKLQERVWRD